MKRVTSIVLLACLAVVPASAHHSFGVVFDADKPVKLTGVVTKVDWRNPHTHLYIDVKDDTGKVVNWTLEGYPPNVLARTGWKKDVTVKVGDMVSILAGAPATDRPQRIFARRRWPMASTSSLDLLPEPAKARPSRGSRT